MIQDTLARLVADAARAAAPDLGLDPDDLPVPELSRPRLKEHGDWSSNVALGLAGKAGRPPREVAEAIVSHLPTDGPVERVEIAGPGFVNLFVRPVLFQDALAGILEAGERFGLAEPTGRRVDVEYVSANPTGPLHVGHARNAALGDALANLLAAAGEEVVREHYFNDAGGQMDRFGASVEARYLQALGRDAQVPEDGYHGDYLKDIAEDILRDRGPGLADLPPEERMPALREEGVRRVLDANRRTLERFGVSFDVYVSESDLQERGEIDAAIQRLRQRGQAYDAEGAVWFRSTAFGDDKDRPLIRSNGTHTYFGADAGYLIDKFGRGFDGLVYVLGADHHGDVARLKGAAAALGYDPRRLETVIYQFVSFLRAGEPMKMSKRAGTFVTLDQLIDEVGTDAARFTLLWYSSDSPMNFDIDEVKRQSLDNPVYYVQYGHARIASILRTADERGVALRPWTREGLTVLTNERELEVIDAIAELPGVIAGAAAARAPHRLPHYAEQVAAAFHRFYRECRVVTDEDATTQARLWLCVAAKQVLATALGLVGVSAPESMARLEDEDEEEGEADGA
jgi:arginyl-tRNA synthetase